MALSFFLYFDKLCAEVISMKKPDLKEAMKRSSGNVNIIRDFKISDDLRTIGINKKYISMVSVVLLRTNLQYY